MRFLSLLGLGLILLLSGCGAVGDDALRSRYDLPQKPGPRMCAFQCRNAFDHCGEGCNLTERACSNDVQAQAIRDYEAYARERFMAHAPTELRPRDFERLGQCTATSCRSSCKSAYNKCFEACGGKIVTQSPCQFLCF